MIKVITYGTYDFFHYGHQRLLERAKALGDYLIVGVTAEDFDKTRGKINVQQSLMERIESVRATGLADEIIIEEYEGQKIDDIKKHDVDIFTVGSDWEGKFDYLNEYCKVIYLPRTEGISSSEIREEISPLRLGMIGDGLFLNKVSAEAELVNGIKISAVCSGNKEVLAKSKYSANSFDELLENCDAVYIRSKPEEHYEHIKRALKAGKHVLCESPVTLSAEQTEELLEFAQDRELIMMEAIKTAYATAYSRLLLLLKDGRIGEIVSVDATCTSLSGGSDWESIYEWGPTALLPVFQILGTDYLDCRIFSHVNDEGNNDFTKIDFTFGNSVASIKVGDGVKSEGELIISGTKGYIYVPAPWWKTDYFEIRYEDQSLNRRYFYQLDGEGIRYELVSFVKEIARKCENSKINSKTSKEISNIMKRFKK